MHRHHQQSTVWQMWLCLIDPVAESEQILVELTVVEGMQFHGNSLWMRDNPASELEKRSEALPGSMGIAGRKIVIARPHDQIGQRELADAHDLVFLVIQLIHHPLAFLQIF